MASSDGKRVNGSRALCVAAIRDLGRATVAETAARARLSRPTVEAALADLTAEGLVETAADQVQHGEAGGRPARQSRFRAETGVVVGVDLSGAEMRVLLTDLAGRTVALGPSGRPSCTDAAPELGPVVVVIEETLARAGFSRADLRAAGIGVAGLVSRDGEILTSPVGSWVGTNLAARFTDLLGVPAAVDNDLSLAAAAESRFGALEGAGTGVYALTWHHVSARITVDGAVLRGRHSSAGEVGLLRSFSDIEVPAGPLNESIARISRPLERLLADPSDAEGIRTQEALVSAMTPAIAALVLAVDPDVVVLGGELARYGQLLGPDLAAAVGEFAEGAGELDVVITPASLGRDGVSVGAAHRAFEDFSTAIYGTDGVAPPRVRPDLSRGDDRSPAVPRLALLDGGGALGEAVRAAPWASGIRGHADVADLLALDPAPEHVFVDLAGPARAGAARAVLARGIAVTLAAPPPALDELDELLEVAVRDGVSLAVDHAPRRSPAVRTLRACVDAGLVGDVTAVWCRHLAAGGEAVTRDQLASDVDVLHWLARGTTESCGAVGSAPGPAGREGGEPQVSAIAFTLDNGVSAGYLRGWGAGPGRRFYTVVGTAGRLEGDGDDVRFIRAGGSEPPGPVPLSPPEPLPHPSAATPGPARSVLEARATLAAVQAAWLSLLRDGERCRVDPPAAPVTHSTRENEEESRC
ncbi:ROK family protein [Streptomyces sp. DSM 41979]|uniref:ROK family protein n=1 Tax=Streptomyces evansiae TaxID=3075535 RepID=A0ABU2R1N3_9ACTN|nr:MULTISPECIES: ROK family protein [unclassified Streptomyces]MDT0410161.1 ROK family protein [Streptomyces sp. DSM 41979]